jgi:hypothetical protein
MAFYEKVIKVKADVAAYLIKLISICEFRTDISEQYFDLARF